MANNKSAPAAVSRSASTASSDAGSNDGSNGGSIPTALPTHEAMRILLSPDGYYEYLGIPKPNDNSIMDSAISGLKYNNNNNDSSSSSSSIDLERVKKNYRRLSLKHHPDRRTGNAEAFRMLNRAKIVLSNSKLRREYDLLGLDLDDDAEEEEEEEEEKVATTTEEEAEEEEEENEKVENGEDDDDVRNSVNDANSNSNNGTKQDTSINEGTHRRHRPTNKSSTTNTTKTKKGEANSSGQHGKDKNKKSNNNKNSNNSNGGGDTGGGSKTETVMGHLASASLAVVLQVVVRTGLMGVVSVVISRYTILTYLAIGALTFLSYKLYSSLKKTLSGSNVKITWAVAKESFSPIMIAFGIYCMYRGRRYVMITAPDTADAPASAAKEVGVVAAAVVTTYLEWSWTFWLGETTVMSSFLCNSFEKQTRGIIVGFSIFSLLLSLWLRGKFWRYSTLLGLEAFVAMLIVIVFPIMEMILESIVEEKMRKVGEKIRAHDKRMKELLRKEAGAG